MRLLGGFSAAPGRLQPRESIPVPLEAALGASRVASWSEFGTLLGVLEGPHEDEVGTKRPPEAKKKVTLSRTRI